jgi:hypothetical protein
MTVDAEVLGLWWIPVALELLHLSWLGSSEEHGRAKKTLPLYHAEDLSSHSNQLQSSQYITINSGKSRSLELRIVGDAFHSQISTR